MIYMTRLKLLFIFILIFILGSCSYISYSQAIPLLDKAIFGVDDIELTQEYIDSKEYSFVKVKLGKSSVSILTLRSIKEDVFEWISATGERIYTFNGKIIKTEGLPYDFYFYSFRDKNFLEIGSDIKLNYDLHLLNPNAFVSQVSYFTAREHNDNYLYIDEMVETTGFRWKYINTYIYNKESKLPYKTVQFIHPKLNRLELTFIYK